MPIAHVNGIEIKYEVHGSGAPLVLAHGYSGSLEMWREQVPGLSSKYRLVIYDTRGHGKSTAPADMHAYSIERDYAGDQLALMDHLGISQSYVGGLSMGGMIAQEFVCQHPERVAALLLFDTGPGGAPRDAAMAARFEQFRAMMATAARTKGMGAVLEMMRANAGAGIGLGAKGQLPDSVRRHLRGMAEMSIDGYLSGARAMQAWRGTMDRLSAITAPTLVVVGERDGLLGPSRAMHAQIAGSRFVLVRDSGHGTNMWRPRAFERATLDFLADVDAGRAVAGEFAV
ncbi:MAG: alpha/beta fold hydrolase [Dehalococcoidia bacterium]